MKALAKFVVLFAMCLSVLAGFSHQHDSGASLAGHRDCPACQWQASAVTDIPVIFWVVAPPRLAIPFLPAAIVAECPASVWLPASRAPPVA